MYTFLIISEDILENNGNTVSQIQDQTAVSIQFIKTERVWTCHRCGVTYEKSIRSCDGFHSQEYIEEL